MGLISLLFGLCFGLLAFVIIRLSSGAKEKMKQRLEESSASKPQASLLRKKQPALSDVEIFRKLLFNRRANTEKIVLLLKTARLKISVAVFLLACVLMGSVIFFALQFYIHWSFAAALSLTAMLVPLFYLNHRRKVYLKKFAENLPNALAMLGGAIRAGNSLQAAIAIAARSSPHPVSDELDVAQSEIRLGIPLQKALEHVNERVKNPEFKILMTGIAVHQELGGNLSEILNNLEKTIRERFALMREIHTLSAQGRYSAWVLFAIPIVLLALYMKSDPKQFIAFVRSSYGSVIIGISVFLDIVGFIWIRKIVDLKE